MAETGQGLSHVAGGAGESILVMTDLVTVKARSETFALTEVATPSGGGPPGLHRHTDQETFFVLDGQYRFDTLTAGGQPASVPAARGDVVQVPSMTWHNYKNVGEAAGRLLVMLQPGSLIDFFRELGVPVSDPANLPRPAGPPDAQRIRAITQKHHVEMYH